MENECVFEYQIKEDKAVITGISEGGSVIAVPEKINSEGRDFTVTEIGKKAFSGCRGIREVILPRSVEAIGDWAFAKCISLKNITVPRMGQSAAGDFSLGRKVFEGCTSLEAIVMDEEALSLNGKDDLSYLAAALTAKLPGEYLLHDEDMGSDFWYEKWDLALNSYLKTGDYEGYTDTVLCGEEDISYDGIGSVDGELLGETYEYVKNICKAKSFLCYLRLIHDERLSDENRQIYTDYIRAHKKGSGNEAAWLVIKDDEDERTDFLTEYVNVVGDELEIIDELLEDIPDNRVKMRTYLISLGKKEEEEDIFDLMKL